MAIDDLLSLAKGLLDGWNNGKLKRTLRRTAQEALDNKIKVIELEEKLRQQEDQIRRLKGEKPKPQIKPTSTGELNPTPKKKHEKKSKIDDIEIDETINLVVPKEDLPKDAKFIGKRNIVSKSSKLPVWIR
jgi:hemolysin activation/secretion protein